jgi:hypothetical protein
MMPEDDKSTIREGNNSRGVKFDSSLIAVPQADFEAVTAAGDRLAASADAEATPLPIVRLPPTTGDDGQP